MSSQQQQMHPVVMTTGGDFPAVNLMPRFVNPGTVQLIGIAGQAGSGKSMFAEVACKHFGFHRMPFAKYLKRIAVRDLGLTEDQVSTTAGKREHNALWGMSNREVLQRLGTDAMQPVFGEQVWVKLLHTELYHMHGERPVGRSYKVIIDDVRYPWEVAYIVAEMCGDMVWCRRTMPAKGEPPVLSTTERAHASENSLTSTNLHSYMGASLTRKLPHLAINEGSLEEWQHKVTEVLAGMLQPVPA